MLRADIWKSYQPSTSLENDMQYKCIRGVITSQGPLSVGDVVTLPHSEALVLIAHKKIEIFEEVRVAEAPKVEHRDPVITEIENRDPVVKRSSKNGD
jgi:DNA replication initiation complex subunit (GINS family)